MQFSLFLLYFPFLGTVPIIDDSVLLQTECAGTTQRADPTYGSPCAAAVILLLLLVKRGGWGWRREWTVRVKEERDAQQSWWASRRSGGKMLGWRNGHRWHSKWQTEFVPAPFPSTLYPFTSSAFPVWTEFRMTHLFGSYFILGRVLNIGDILWSFITMHRQAPGPWWDSGNYMGWPSWCPRTYLRRRFV